MSPGTLFKQLAEETNALQVGGNESDIVSATSAGKNDGGRYTEDAPAEEKRERIFVLVVEMCGAVSNAARARDA